MRSVVNKDYNYITYKKKIAVLCVHKKILEYRSTKKDLSCLPRAVKFVFLDLYQEGFFSTHYYGFFISSKNRTKIKLFRPSDRSFLKFSLNFPGLLYLKVLSRP
jgi:hypothetical protein